MSNVNPLVAAILPSSQTQRHQSAERVNQVRRAQDVKKNAAHTKDSFEHQVESSEEITPVHQDDSRPDQHRKRDHRKRTPSAHDETEDSSGLDLTA